MYSSFREGFAAAERAALLLAQMDELRLSLELATRWSGDGG